MIVIIIIIIITITIINPIIILNIIMEVGTRSLVNSALSMIVMSIASSIIAVFAP